MQGTSEGSGMNTEFSIDPAAMLSKVIAFHAGQPQTRQGNLSLRPRRRRTIPDDNAPVQPKQTCDDYSRLLSTACAARYLGVSAWTVRRLVYAGELPAQRGKRMRFDKKDLDRFIEKTKEVVKI
jgi:excisionase family DNA binding protein